MLKLKSGVAVVVMVAVTSGIAAAWQPPERGNYEGQPGRPLRYHPDGTDFVIENGAEFFNRPLYGGNTAFRADAGDRPEVMLYAPGQAGNWRLAVRRGEQVIWLHRGQRIISRYRPGAMLYEIQDPLLGQATLHLSIHGLYEAEGVMVRIAPDGAEAPVELLAAFGGAGGKTGRRNGDIGCETEPVGRFFQLRPEHCHDNVFRIDKTGFILESNVARIAGTISSLAQNAIADAAFWDDAAALAASAGKPTQQPVLLTAFTVQPDQPVYLALKKIGQEDAPAEPNDLGDLYARTEQQRQAIAGRVTVQTPDPYINAAVAALCAAADGIWDEKTGSVMHGAVAWRAAYAGWRGPYANDACGWHDRSKRHLKFWAARQNTQPVPETRFPPDPEANLARNHPSKQSNGDIGGKHYDMNLVYIDALLRHLMWTGDMELAETLWPVIERHFAWQKRLFRRPFGDDKLPLYEAYAAIWASDAMQFDGGGVAYSSAYNYYHNRLAAALATQLGKDPQPYRAEADLILQGMRRHLWLSDRGWYGEQKDWLGLQRVHSSAGLWTFYHILDSEAADAFEAWQMSRFVDTQIAHIPVYGGDIPQGACFTLPTTNWMPYIYSTNNVVMAEAAHTALAYWQTGRAEKAFALLKGAMLDGMYMGLCPGNAGMTTHFDPARDQSQRDFGDAVGTLTRAVVEGLFGVRPNVPAGTVTVAPGFPEQWDSARLTHPQISIDYARRNGVETFAVQPGFSAPVALTLIVPARTVEIERLTVNGQAADWQPCQDAAGLPRIAIAPAPSDAYNIEIVWKGPDPEVLAAPAVVATGRRWQVNTGVATLAAVKDPQRALAKTRVTPHAVEADAVGALGHRTVFARVQQGQMTWWSPLEFEIRPPYEILALPDQPIDGLAFCVRNNTDAAIEHTATLETGGQAVSTSLTIPAYGQSEAITLTSERMALLPGSNRIIVQWGRDGRVEGVVTNWRIRAQDRPRQWQPLDLSAILNDRVTQIFKHDYVSPRSPFCSLALPRHGFGNWCQFAETFDVEDGGLRQAARDGNGRIVLPQGIPFATSGTAETPNIVFTSQWDNFPAEVTVPLTGKAAHLYLLMAGSTDSMHSRFENGRVIVTYADGGTETLALHNPTTWWPIDQDYWIDDYAFRRPEAIPPRVHLKSGDIVVTDLAAFKGRGGKIPGGAATVLDLPLHPDKTLSSLRIQTQANDVIIGLMSATLLRE